ncbi:MAG: DinB family protein [Spirochaetales bacterium]|nr:DinB family protein [Spirochaetales bacterium]
MVEADVLGRLIAASEDLTDHGMLNLQKLLEALVFALVRVQARRHRRQGDPAERIGEIDRLIRGLPPEAVSPELLGLLERAVRRYGSEAEGDLTYLEAPNVFVCRGCGHAAVGAAPPTCPECGEAYGVFRRFQGMFNGDNAAPEDPAALIEQLEANARQLESLVEGLQEADCVRRPLTGRWSMRDQVRHFLDAQAVLIGRVALILTQEEPVLNTAAPYETATESGGRPALTREILARYLSDRSSLTQRLRGLGLRDLWKCGRHEDFGLVSIMHQVKYFAQHEQAHLGTVAELSRILRG